MASLEDHARQLKRVGGGQFRKGETNRDAVKMVLRVADDNMRPLRVLVARILASRPCDCGWPKQDGDDDVCYCKECDLR